MTADKKRMKKKEEKSCSSDGINEETGQVVQLQSSLDGRYCLVKDGML